MNPHEDRKVCPGSYFSGMTMAASAACFFVAGAETRFGRPGSATCFAIAGLLLGFASRWFYSQIPPR